MDPDRLFAQVNDSIRNLATEATASEQWEFFCECPDLTCHTLVSLTLLEFDELRAASPPMPVFATGHDGLVGPPLTETHLEEEVRPR